VVDINSREQLAAWLREQPREVSMMLGVRWTMRALPLVVLYRGDLLSDLVLPCFRVVAVSWAAVKYPAHEMKHKADAARANAARAFPIAPAPHSSPTPYSPPTSPPPTPPSLLPPAPSQRPPTTTPMPAPLPPQRAPVPLPPPPAPPSPPPFGPLFPPTRHVGKEARQFPLSPVRHFGSTINRSSFGPCGRN
jgi:hypothetical protein